MSHSRMNDKLTEGVDANDYYENERRMAAHAQYSQGSPGYGLQMTQPGVIQAAPAVVILGEQPWVWNWCTIVTTVIAFFLCPLCGFTGTVFGLLSYTDHQAQHYNNARSKKNMALCCGITGIIISVVWILIIIGVMASGVMYAPREITRVQNNFN